MKTSWAAMLEGAGRPQLETALVPAFLARQRWFEGKTRRIRATRIVDWSELPLSTAVLALMEVTYDTGEQTPPLFFLATTHQLEADQLRQEFPHAIVCRVTSRRRPGLVHDAMLDNTACALLSLIERTGSLAMREGRFGVTRDGVVGPAGRAEYVART